MSGVHRLGHMSETASAPEYQPMVVHLPVTLTEALDRHIVNRVHEDDEPPAPEAMASERDAIIALALRAHIDHWPDLAPPGTYAGRGGARDAERAGREGPAPSTTEGAA